MFGIAASEYLLIIIVAVLVLGPEHLPKVLRTFAKLVSNFRRITTEVQRVIDLESLEAESLLHTTTNHPIKKKKTKTATKKKHRPHTIKHFQQSTSSSPSESSPQEDNVTQHQIKPNDVEIKQKQDIKTSTPHHYTKKQEHFSEPNNSSESSDPTTISKSRSIDTSASISLHDTKELS